MNNDEEVAPLFTFRQALLLPLTLVICFVVSYVFIGFFLHNIAAVHQSPLWMKDSTFMQLFTVKLSIVVATIILLFKLKIRLQKQDNPEHLSSYLGFHQPNWVFWGKWTLIVVAIHALMWSSNITPTKDRILEDVLQYGLWLPLISILIVAPVWEEIFFRGILWTAIHDSVQKNSEQIAFWISSLAFAVGHMNFTVSAMVQYLAFSWLAIRARTHGGSLALAIWLHFLSNFLVMAEALWAMSQRVQAA